MIDKDDIKEKNKELVLKFYDIAINQKNFDRAKGFLGNPYIQHNPNIGDGEEGLFDFIEFFRKNFPKSHVNFKRVIAEDDYVVLHSSGENGPHPNGTALVDIFRVKDGKIMEHWDVMQEVPKVVANSNSMF
jgi:predicted SnoaL-like aldol condensation-catalyzing enzyme